MNIGFTYDLRDDYINLGFNAEDCCEFDSKETIEAIVNALTKNGHLVEKIGHIKQLTQHLVNGKRWDIVFNIAEGVKGRAREAQIPAMLEAYDIPYVFSDSLVMALTLDKATVKHLVRDFDIPTAKFIIAEDQVSLANTIQSLAFPVFAKPNAEGSSKGISVQSIVYSETELRNVCQFLWDRYNQPVLIETFLPGREFTVGILGTGSDAQVLGTMEITLRSTVRDACYTRAVKENYTSTVDYHIAHDSEAKLAAETALKVWRVLGCRDAGRIDLRSNDLGVPHFLEVNPLAGLHPKDSDLVILSNAIGINYDVLIQRILEAALLRSSKKNPP